MKQAVVILYGALILSFLFCDIKAKVYTKCGLAQELLNLGYEKSYVGNWVCLIESESGKDTSKQINKANGGTALGLFQINSKEYCTFGRPGGKCNAKCEDFLDDEIYTDAVCAKKIQTEHGFKYWEGWTRSCYGRSYPAKIIQWCSPQAPAKNLSAYYVYPFPVHHLQRFVHA